MPFLLDRIRNHRQARFMYACLVWGLSALFMFYKYGLEVCPSIMTNELRAAFGATATQLGNFGAAYFYAYFCMQIPVGILLDYFGPRYLTSGAILLAALGAVTVAGANTLLIADLGRFIMGLGASFAAVSSFKLTAMWFAPNRFALMAGLTMTAGMLGAVGGEGPLAALVGSVGWRSTWYILALTGILLSILFWLLVREFYSARDVSVKSTSAQSLLESIKTIARHPQSWFLSIYSGLSFSTVTLFGGLWGVPYLAVNHHLSQVKAGALVSLIFIGFAIGCPLAGYLSDYCRARKPWMTGGTGFALVMMLMVLYAPLSAWGEGVCLFLFGVGISCFFLSFSMIREIHPAPFAATALGFMNAFNALIGAAVDPIVGKLLDLQKGSAIASALPVFTAFNYRVALLIAPLSLVIALVLLFFIKETLPKLSKK